MPTLTARSFIIRALRIINAINVGEVPDSEEANDGLALFNAMLGNWATQRLTIPYSASVEYPTEVGKKVYSIGPGGDWDGVRPIKIRAAWMRIGDTHDIPLEVYEMERYGNIPLKGLSSPQSQGLYYEAQYPLGFVTLYPVPTSIFGVVMAVDGTFADLTLNTDMSGLPQGYALAMQYQLAKLLAVEYGKPMSEDAKTVARESFAAIKSANIKALDAQIDPQLINYRGAGFDIRLG